ncbi:MAG: hypothetical protein IJ087_03075 [Eggerthellaceae bacterium]|nr:hypothetical protein [Eggerthellaceae bacterium]
MYLTIPTIRVSALPHFSMSGEFNPETGAVPSVNVSSYARGGFTDSPIAIAGEAGREAVISFDPRYRNDNITYWYEAGEMLGVLQPLASAAADHGGAQSSVSIEVASSSGSLASAAGGVGGSGGMTVDFGGVTFAPKITVSGTGKQDVLTQLRRAEEEFFDMLDEWADEREGDYAPIF